MGIDGAFRFGVMHGPFRFVDAHERVRAEGAFDGGRATGLWRLYDERGALIDEMDADARALLRAPRLSCPIGNRASVTGEPWFGSRICVDAAGVTVSGYDVRDCDVVDL